MSEAATADKKPRPKKGKKVPLDQIFATKSSSWADVSEDLTHESGPSNDTHYERDEHRDDSRDRPQYDRQDRQDRQDRPGGGERRERREDRPQKEVPDHPPYNAYIGNLSYDAKEDDLRDFFVDSQIKSVRLLIDRETGRLKGYGYVEFEDADSLRAALRLSGSSFLNRTIRVDVSEQRERKEFDDRRRPDDRREPRESREHREPRERHERPPSRSDEVEVWERGKFVERESAPRQERRDGGRDGGGGRFGGRDDGGRYGGRDGGDRERRPDRAREDRFVRGDRNRENRRDRESIPTDEEDQSPKERTPLQLKPRTVGTGEGAGGAGSKASPFGGARPREEVLKDKPKEDKPKDDDAAAPAAASNDEPKEDKPAAKPKSNPFGDARPREEVLKDKPKEEQPAAKDEPKADAPAAASKDEPKEDKPAAKPKSSPFGDARPREGHQRRDDRQARGNSPTQQRTGGGGGRGGGGQPNRKERRDTARPSGGSAADGDWKTRGDKPAAASAGAAERKPKQEKKPATGPATSTPTTGKPGDQNLFNVLDS